LWFDVISAHRIILELTTKGSLQIYNTTRNQNMHTPRSQQKNKQRELRAQQRVQQLQCYTSCDSLHSIENEKREAYTRAQRRPGLKSRLSQLWRRMPSQRQDIRATGIPLGLRELQRRGKEGYQPYACIGYGIMLLPPGGPRVSK